MKVACSEDIKYQKYFFELSQGNILLMPFFSVKPGSCSVAPTFLIKEFMKYL